MKIQVNDVVLSVLPIESACGKIGKVLKIGQNHDNVQLFLCAFDGIAEWCLMSELIVLSPKPSRKEKHA